MTQRFPAQHCLAVRFDQPSERSQEFALPVSGNAGNTDNLTAVRRHCNIVKAFAREPLHHEHLAAMTYASAFFRIDACDGAADDQTHHLVIRHVADRPRALDDAVTHHRGILRDPPNLLEPMGNVYDCRTASGGPSDLFKSNSTRSAVSGAVGSSRIRSLGSIARALASSISWR